MAGRIDRRRLLAVAALALSLPASHLVSGQAAPRTVRIVARKFVFEPREIHLKKGETVKLELTSLDIVMGFSLGAFKLRADVIPGKVATLMLTADKAGRFDFICDVFCGSGHEEMEGAVIVDG